MRKLSLTEKVEIASLVVAIFALLYMIVKDSSSQPGGNDRVQTVERNNSMDAKQSPPGTLDGLWVDPMSTETVEFSKNGVLVLKSSNGIFSSGSYLTSASGETTFAVGDRRGEVLSIDGDALRLHLYTVHTNQGSSDGDRAEETVAVFRRPFKLTIGYLVLFIGVLCGGILFGYKWTTWQEITCLNLIGCTFSAICGLLFLACSGFLSRFENNPGAVIVLSLFSGIYFGVVGTTLLKGLREK